jgi:hypothetical protein
MRKESIGRLLLSLLTAFVMVAGVFATAVFTAQVEWNEAPSVTVNDDAAGELEREKSVVGEAPISAISGEQTNGMFTSRSRTTSGNSDTPATPMIAFDEIEEQRDEPEFERPERPTTTTPDRGTRAPTLDANGPYGTKDDPKYEGEEIDFTATIIGGNNNDYKFRWDLESDGVYEGPGSGPDGWGGYGESDMEDYEYLDNAVGLATCEAWDTVSYYPPYNANMLDETYYNYYYWLPVPRFYLDPPPNGDDGTWGLQFDVYKDTTVDQIGFFKTYAPNPMYNVKLWEMETETCIGVNLAITPLPYYNWKWVSIHDPADPFGPPITVNLEAGKSYIVSAHIEYYDGRYPIDSNPGMTAWRNGTDFQLVQHWWRQLSRRIRANR